MENLLLDYAGYDALSTILTKERVVAITTSNLFKYGNPRFLPIYRTILETGTIPHP